jgi:hypothetical protein
MAPPLIRLQKKGNSVCGFFRGAQKLDEKSDSVPLNKNRFRSAAIGELEIVYSY